MGNNSMHLAAYKGWQEAVEKLNKADETLKIAQNNVGVTPLMYAARSKNFGIVKFLIEQGVNPKIVNKSGWNILHYSCHFGVFEGNHLIIFTYSWVGW